MGGWVRAPPLDSGLDSSSHNGGSVMKYTSLVYTESDNLTNAHSYTDQAKQVTPKRTHPHGYTTQRLHRKAARCLFEDLGEVGNDQGCALLVLLILRVVAKSLVCPLLSQRHSRHEQQQGRDEGGRQGTQRHHLRSIRLIEGRHGDGIQTAPHTYLPKVVGISAEPPEALVHPLGGLVALPLGRLTLHLPLLLGPLLVVGNGLECEP
mmetsp:Transcript_23159/g.57295  ORF Transcript_23159/g.57295 Transcript_23159/m.57295 type:complete len:207 (+) Transcript_23159:1184-1804(+)